MYVCKGTSSGDQFYDFCLVWKSERRKKRDNMNCNQHEPSDVNEKQFDFHRSLSSAKRLFSHIYDKWKVNQLLLLLLPLREYGARDVTQTRAISSSINGLLCSLSTQSSSFYYQHAIKNSIFVFRLCCLSRATHSKIFENEHTKKKLKTLYIGKRALFPLHLPINIYWNVNVIR